MPQQSDLSVLVYGNSSYLDVVKRKLKKLSNFRIIHVDSGGAKALNQLTTLNARIMICDQESASTDIVTAFMAQKPYVPVVGIAKDKDRELVIKFHEFSRLETSGLPQILQVLGC